MEEHKYTNRLIHEKSPYLLQHAHNPVNWYPWGEEAFHAAKEAKKPIFLSIGYATCHWCHVMEEESFEDPDVAEALNEAFICIKVDREELPHIDSLYMEFAQTMIVGSAGWPLNVILTPDLKPFFAATYMPKESSKGLVGVLELTEKISKMWTSDEQERICMQADRLVDILKAHVHVQGSELPGYSPIAKTADVLYRVADPIWGGMRSSPKFPLGYHASFLLRYYQMSQDSRALFLVEKTLEMMSRGGIFDHLGGGFHRYSVDEHWHVPHFEKMLYDNALLADGYLEAWRVTHRPEYRDVLESILTYVSRDMTSPEGGFYSAEDADSAGIEGLYYTWTRNEVLSILGDADGTIFCDLFGIYDHGLVEGRSVMHMVASIDEFSETRKLDTQAVHELVHKAKDELFKERIRRILPLKDEKIITSWNGLMIHAFAEAGFYLGCPEYIHKAARAAEFIKNHLYKNRRLMRRYVSGEAKFSAGLDDFAFYIRGLLSLFEAGGGARWLELAEDLAHDVEELFKAEAGAYYQAQEADEHLLVRKSQYSDGAEPSGNAVHAENLVRLWQITGKKHYLEQAEDIFKAVQRFIESYPLGYCYHLIALERYFDTKKRTIVVAYNAESEHKEALEDALRNRHSSHYAVVFCHSGETGAHVRPTINNATTLYICQDGVCKKPLTSIDEMLKALSSG